MATLGGTAIRRRPASPSGRLARSSDGGAAETGDDTRVKGHSYPQNWYEDAIGALLARVGRVDDRVITEIVRRHAEYEQHPDQLGLARIERARDEAARQLNKTRDIDAWRATTARLDAEEAIARQFDGPTRLSAVEIVDYLRSLPRLWADAGPDARQTLAVAIFARLDVLGFQRLEYELTPDAIDLPSATRFRL